MGYWRLWVITGRFWCKMTIWYPENVWVIRGYGLRQVWVKRGSTVPITKHLVSMVDRNANSCHGWKMYFRRMCIPVYEITIIHSGSSVYDHLALISQVGNMQYCWLITLGSWIWQRYSTALLKTVRDSLNTHPPQWPCNLEKRGSSSARLSTQSRYRFSRWNGIS